MYGLSRHSVSLLVIFRQNVVELFDYMPARLVLCTSVQDSVTFCIVLAAASDVMSGVALGKIGLFVKNFVILDRTVLERKDPPTLCWTTNAS